MLQTLQLAIFALALTGSASTYSRAQDDSELCGLSPAQFMLKEDQHKRHDQTYLPILAPNTFDSKPSAVVARSFVLAVNTDGAPTSYAAADPQGRTYGLNNVCNANVRMSEFDSQLAEGENGYCGTTLPKSRYFTLFDEFRKRDWKPTETQSITWDSGITPTIEIQDDADRFVRPCPEITLKFKRNDGSTGVRKFLVNATKLKQAGFSRKNPCDQSKYINSMKFRALVIPKGGFYGALAGDLVVISNNKSPDRLVYAIVGDAGPNGKFAEGSIALNRAVLGLEESWRPRNYIEAIRSLDKEKSQMPLGIDVLILNGSRQGTMKEPEEPTSQILARKFTQAELDEIAKERFEKWGGRARFDACRRKLGRIGPPDAITQLFEALALAFSPAELTE